MSRLLRHLVIFGLLGVAVLGVIVGLHRREPDTELIWALKEIAFFPAALLAFLLAYIALLVSLSLLTHFLLKRSPLWAERLARLQGRLSKTQAHRITLLALHKDNPEKADQLWSEVEPLLPTLRTSEAMALTSNYSASLSMRGQYARARDLMIAHEPKEISGAYKHFYALYWLNLGFYQHQLDDLEAARYCLRRVQLEHISMPMIKERQQGLEALLASEVGDREGVLSAVRQTAKKGSYLAFYLAELGEMQEARERLPELSGLSEASDRFYYHLGAVAK